MEAPQIFYGAAQQLGRSCLIYVEDVSFREMTSIASKFNERQNTVIAGLKLRQEVVIQLQRQPQTELASVPATSDATHEQGHFYYSG
jgi:hypothetical protein